MAADVLHKREPDSAFFTRKRHVDDCLEYWKRLKKEYEESDKAWPVPWRPDKGPRLTERVREALQDENTATVAMANAYISYKPVLLEGSVRSIMGPGLVLRAFVRTAESLPIIEQQVTEEIADSKSKSWVTCLIPTNWVNPLAYSDAAKVECAVEYLRENFRD